MKLTPWFKTSVNPVHKGVYQRKPHNLMMYSYWDGKEWYVGSNTPYMAVIHYRTDSVSEFQKAKWRGIAQQPI